jgi:phosphomannomutase
MTYIKRYAAFLKKFLKPKRKIRVVFDCSDGTTGMVLEELFGSHALVRSTLMNAWPDGNFPAHGPNPLAKGATRQLAAEVKRQKADLGVIFDADGDRVFFVDNRGRLIDSNESAYILMHMFAPPYVVGEVSSWRIKKCQASGVRCQRYISKVGHYFFKKLMREKKASLGLEHSGHFYFKDFFYCDSGILAAIEVINFISRLPEGIAEWLDALPEYHRSGEINFEVEDKERALKRIEKFYRRRGCKITKIDGLTVEFGPSPLKARPLSRWLASHAFKGEGWFNIRPSNTENLLRLNLEATKKEILQRELRNIRDMI